MGNDRFWLLFVPPFRFNSDWSFEKRDATFKLDIFIFNIKDPFFDRAEATATNVYKIVEGCKICVYDLKDETMLKRCLDSSDILANTTRVGMAPDTDSLPIPSVDFLNPNLVVSDAIYNPKVTRLIREAADIGCKTFGGTGMLIHQGAAALKLFTGADMSIDEVHELVFGKWAEHGKFKGRSL